MAAKTIDLEVVVRFCPFIPPEHQIRASAIPSRRKLRVHGPTILLTSHLHSTRVLGTFGYHAPDFGVVLLELLTGRKPVDHNQARGQKSLVTWATPRLSEDKVKQCVDPKLKGDYPPKGRC